MAAPKTGTRIAPASKRTEREREIVEVATRLFREQGPASLTVRQIATELGGSMRLVTYYFPQMDELLRALTMNLLEVYRREAAEIESDAEDPRQNLRHLIIWMLPLDRERRREERSRVLLAAASESGLDTRSFYIAIERQMRSLLRKRLRPLVSEEQVEPYTDLLRAFHNGMALSATEHPSLWTAKRQLATMDLLLDSLGLSGTERTKP